MPQVSKVKAFVLIAREGSISGAARQLRISTATASAHLDSLESLLGGKLFIRSTRQLILTDLGRLYLQRVTPAIDKLEVANQVALEFGASPQGMLRVTVGGPIGRRRIAPLVARFRDQHPKLGISLNIDDKFRSVIDEEFHVAIRAGYEESSNLIQRKVASNRRVLVASPDYLADAPPLNSPDDLTNHTLLLLTQRQDGKGTMRFSIDAQTCSIELDGDMTSNNNEALTVWVMQHCGIAQKSLWEVSDAITEKKLVRLLPDFEPEPIDFYAVSPFRTGESIKVDTFISFLRAEFSKNPLC